MLVAVAFRARDRQSSDIRNAITRIQEHTERISEKQGEILLGVQQVTLLLRDTYDLLSFSRQARCAQLLQRIVQRDAHLATLIVAAPDGEVLCNAVESPQGMNIADRSYFKHALGTSGHIVGEAIVERSTDKWSLPVAQAFRDETGRALGVIVATLDLQWIPDEFKKAGYPRDARIGLIDDHGLVLVRYPDPERLTGTDMSTTPFFKMLKAHRGGGMREEFGFDNVRRTYAFAHFADTIAGPVYFWIGLSTASITNEADRQFTTTMVVMSLLAVAVFALIWFGGDRFILRPLAAISTSTRRLGDGDYLARTNVTHSNDEIGQLAHSIDEMARALASKSEVLRLNRALKVLLTFNRALVQARSEIEMVEATCRSLVETGGYRMAWVGFAEQDAGRSVRPVAECGFDKGYLASAQISWDDSVRGRGPTGSAIRLGTTQVNQNYSANSSTAPWREEAQKRGYQSSCALPLKDGSRAFGALTLYASEANGFDSEEIELLETLASDLEAAILNLRKNIAAG